MNLPHCDDPLTMFLNSPTDLSCDSSPAFSSDDSSNSYSYMSIDNSFSLMTESTTPPLYNSNSSQSSTMISSLPTSRQPEICPVYMSDNYYHNSPPVLRSNINTNTRHDIKRYSLPNISNHNNNPFYSCNFNNSGFANNFNNNFSNDFNNFNNFNNFNQFNQLCDNSSQVIYKPLSNPFTQKILCFLSSEGTINIHCDICDSFAVVEMKVGSNAIMSCGHYVVCNECRGRTVRRILRCVRCCTELASSFPVCGTTCVGDINAKEPSNTGNCPRCGEKLQREICNASCTRRRSEEYSNVRKILNRRVAIFVLNINECMKSSKQGIWRPCSHYSYCVVHKLICKGHGKEVMCHICKRVKKKIDRRGTPTNQRIRRNLSRSSPK